MPRSRPSTATAPARAAAQKTAPLPAQERGFSPSSHLLDLTHLHVKDTAALRKPAPKKPLFPFLLASDDEHRSLSQRPRGFGHFPPRDAKTMTEALLMTGKHLLNDHPLSELSIIAVPRLLIGSAVWPITKAIEMWRAPAKVVTPAEPDAAEMRTPEAAAEAPATPRLRAQSLPATPLAFFFELPLAWKRSLVAFSGIAMMAALPFVARDSFQRLEARAESVLASGREGLALLKAAGAVAAENDLAGASAAFGAASSRFDETERSLGVLGRLMASAAETSGAASPLSAARPLLDAAQHMSRAAEMLTGALAGLENDASPTDKMATLEARLDAALPLLTRGSQRLSDVSVAAVPAPYRETVAEAQRSVPSLVRGITEAKELFAFLRPILGAESGRRYLVLFQNNAELRPTGGFIGSYALIDIDRGELTSVEIPGGGSYDLQGSLRERVAAPQPLRLINPRWEFQDGNWSPDFPTSAKQLQHFYEKAGGPTTDGVIAINATVMEELLAVTGPIAMPEYGKTITAENFRLEAQKAVELEYDREENRPKQFIADLAPKILEAISQGHKEDLPRLATSLSGALGKKDIQIWLSDEGLQSQVAAYGWDGGVKKAEGDYLMVVHTNIAGEKTDLVMEDSIEHEARVLADGSATVTVTLRRTHLGKKGTPFTGVRNVDYVRVYAPAGSTLLEATGFAPPSPQLFQVAIDTHAESALTQTERAARTDADSGTRITEEDGKTAFGNWLQTDPGKTSSATMTYALPPGSIRVIPGDAGSLSRLLGNDNRARLSYSLTLQRQSGAPATAFSSRVMLPRGTTAAWTTGYDADASELILSAQPLTRDLFLGTVAELP